MGEKEDKSGSDGKKKEAEPITVVLKVDMHCEGCTMKVKKCARDLAGVESVKCDESNKKLTMIGKVDPEKIREKLEKKTKKKVELISPIPVKVKDVGAEKKEEPIVTKVTTVTLKIRMHCQGCIEYIRKAAKKMGGVQEVTIDDKKELVVIKGTMDGKKLPIYLEKKLKKRVDVVPPPEKDGAKKDGETKKGDEVKKEEKKEGSGDVKKLEYFDHGYHKQVYWPQYPNPHIFSDENPDSCSIM